MTEETEWLSVPEAAERLGVPLTRVREYLRDRHLLAIRRGENGALYLPADSIVERDGGIEPLPTLFGTLTLLADAGFSDEEAMGWLLADHEALGESPLAALRGGRRAFVRRLAQEMF